jgi:hypothetical protein
LFENQTYKLICGFDSKARYIWSWFSRSFSNRIIHYLNLETKYSDFLYMKTIKYILVPRLKFILF